ncbi:MAG: DapH/DapD/GlmU-related protein [Candidatus Rickettsia vulgarisii]
MSNTIFFIGEQYSNCLVASKLIKQYSSDNINNYSISSVFPSSKESPESYTIFIKSNLIGLTDNILSDFINQSTGQEVFVGKINNVICIIKVNNKELDKFFPNNISPYNHLKNEWMCYNLDSYSLKILDSMEKIINFEQEIQNELRQKAISQGVFLQDPTSTYLSFDTVFGNNVIIEPNVYFHSNVKINDNVHIKAFSYLEGVEIEDGASIGPFARIRGNSKIRENVHIGNFVEIKNSTLDIGTKAGHLSYIGDAEIGKNVNIGAGTITCNYDGLKKHKTIIKDHSFIGSNSALVAPITIGTKSLVGAGSFINQDVPDHTFAIGRSKQSIKPNRGENKYVRYCSRY